MFGHRVVIDARRGANGNAGPVARGQVDGVETDPRTRNGPQRGECLDHPLGVGLRPGNHRVGPGERLDQLLVLAEVPLRETSLKPIPADLRISMCGPVPESIDVPTTCGIPALTLRPARPA